MLLLMMDELERKIPSESAVDYIFVLTATQMLPPFRFHPVCFYSLFHTYAVTFMMATGRIFRHVYISGVYDWRAI